MKKILFILFTVQFILIPRITGSYGANSIGNNHGHSVTNQGKKAIKKDIFGDPEAGRQPAAARRTDNLCRQ